MNPEQEAAALTKEPEAVVVAGPGSGKTHTLIERINLVANDQNYGILITFTNKAARELHQRVKKTIFNKSRWFIGTLHQWSYSLVCLNHESLGYSFPPAIIEGKEEQDLLLLCAETMKYKGPKSKLVYDANSKDRTLSRVFKFYVSEMRRNNITSYDLILEGAIKVLCLDQCPTGTVDHLLVDEFQDSGASDLTIYSLIEANHKWFCGDMDQGIYSFRGANPSLIREHIMDMPTFKLQHSYRCRPLVARTANSLIFNESGRIDKKIIPVHSEESYSKILTFDSQLQEINYAILWAKRTMREGMNCAILARTNRLASAVKEGLRGAGINTYGETKQMPSDWNTVLLLTDFYLCPNRDYTARKYVKLNYPDEANSISDEANRKMLTINEHLTKQDTLTLAVELIDKLTFDCRHRKLITEDSLGIAINAIGDTVGSTQAAMILHRLGGASTDQDFPLSVLTIHSSKGLQWDRVLIVGLNQEIFPGRNNSPELIDEERRVLFVGITRALYSVDLTYSLRRQNPFKQWEVQLLTRSCFLDEL